MLTTRKRLGRGAAMASAGLALWLTACTPPGPRALLDGERLLQKGRPRDAVRRLQTAVEFLPRNAQAWNHLGLAQHASRQPAEALRAYQQAIGLDGKLGVAHFNLGHLWLEQGRPDEAAESFRAYVALEPESVEGWRAHGQALLRVQRWNLAERSFGTALRLRPGDVEALNGLGIAHQKQRRAREAWQCFSEAAQRAPDFAPAWLNLAVAAQQLGARSHAVEAYRRYAALRPEAARSLGIAAILRQLETPLATPNRPAAGAVPVAEVPPPVEASAVPPAAIRVSGVEVRESTGATAELSPAAERSRSPPEEPDGVGADPVAPILLTVAGGEPASNPPPAALPPIPPAEPAADVEADARSVAAAASPPPASDASPADREEPDPPTATVSTHATGGADEVLEPAARGPDMPPSEALETAGEAAVAGVPRPMEERWPETALRVLPQVGLRIPPEPEAGPVGTPVVEAPRTEPLQVVEVPAPVELARATRDEGWVPVLPGMTPAVPLPDDAAAREPGSGGRDAGVEERRGFWSRANPMQWFASDGRGADSEVAMGEGREAAESGRWRWTRPATWFRSGDGSERVSGDEVDRVDRVHAEPSEGVEGVNGLPLLTEPSIRVVRAPTSAGVEEPGAVRSERAETVERLLSGPREIPRYAYLQPNRPPAGDRAAARPVLLLGIQEHRRGRMEAAIAHYTEAIRLDPAALDAYRNLATAHLQQGDLARALAASEWALSLDPDARPARLTLALALERAGYFTDAAIEAERIVASNPDDVAAHLLLGNLYAQQLGQIGRARMHYMRVIELDPEHSQSLAIRRWLAGRR